MVRIRLRRVGAKKQPSYRIVVADQRSPRDGRFIETIGHYNPRTEPATVQYDEERALHWLSVGAQPTDAVRRLFDNLGTYGRLERLRKGEPVAALVEEALAEAEKRGPVDSKTRHEAPQASGKKKPAAVEAAPVVEAEAAVVEAEPESEPAESEAEPMESEAEDDEAPVAEAEPESEPAESEAEPMESEAEDDEAADAAEAE